MAWIASRRGIATRSPSSTVGPAHLREADCGRRGFETRLDADAAAADDVDPLLGGAATALVADMPFDIRFMGGGASACACACACACQNVKTSKKSKRQTTGNRFYRAVCLEIETIHPPRDTSG